MQAVKQHFDESKTLSGVVSLGEDQATDNTSTDYCLHMFLPTTGTSTNLEVSCK